MEGIKIFAAIAASLLLAPPIALADEFVAIGHVTEISLLPEGSDRCPAACPVQVGDLPEGNRLICVSNSCGCGEAHIKIDRVLLGKVTPTVVVKHRLGEWCESAFPLTGLSVLIQLKDSQSPSWSGLHPLDTGDLGFDPEEFTKIGSVVLSDLKTSDGLVSLRELEKRLGL